MESDRHPLSAWIVLRVFAAYVVTLVGLAMLFGRTDMSMFLGAVFASVGLTFLSLLWFYSR
ncbi:MAG: hypothetical protein LAN70_11370 [Acidobacteriia bacterium]|jgi:hypothetical protein|nr:hypothetical protein [Terriglobia bacterium]